MPTLLIHEIYCSVQGESTYSGLPCIFIRLTGCDLRCTYCDTAYAFRGGRTMDLDEILQEVSQWSVPLVEITGGEPMLQKNVLLLMKALCENGRTVLLETSGSHDLSGVDPRVRRIVDMKCPSSGEVESFQNKNLEYLGSLDEIKFVIGDRGDFEWARDAIRKHGLEKKVGSILFSPVFRTAAAEGETLGHGGLEPRKLVEWILEENLPVRFQLQIHKFIWEPTQRGV